MIQVKKKKKKILFCCFLKKGWRCKEVEYGSGEMLFSLQITKIRPGWTGYAAPFADFHQPGRY